MRAQDIANEINSKMDSGHNDFIQPEIGNFVLTQLERRWMLAINCISQSEIDNAESVKIIRERYNYTADNKQELLLTFQLLDIDLEDEVINSLNSFKDNIDFDLSFFLLNPSKNC